VLALALTMALAACGGAAGLPGQGACPTPGAALTDDSSTDAYRAAVVGGIELIQEIDQHFRVAWDERRLRERGEFRADFAVYAHQTECQLRVIKALSAPADGAMAEFGTGLDAIVGDYLVAMTAGRDAVEKRNASAYDDWIKQVDALAVALGDRRDQLLGLD
jgi:hypothetical protein